MSQATTVTDIYGNVITQSADGTWTRLGVTVGPCDADTALGVFNAQDPVNNGVQEPTID